MTINNGSWMNDQHLGCPVYSRDGHLLGRVQEIRGTAFKVDAPMSPDYWLGAASVAAADPDGLTLAVDKDRISEAQVIDPAIGTDSPAVVVPAPAAPADYVPVGDAVPPDNVPGAAPNPQ